jgi:chromosome segregation ATPase
MGVVTSIAIAAGVAAAAGATTSAIAAKQAKDERDKQNTEAGKLQQQLTDLENSRPTFQNPYENMTNQFENLDNPYANLTVATEAFKMQAEQADMALANSLDVMMETGQAAGGATALAQAALQSKRGIAASINAQETQNKRMAAEGEANVALQKAQGAQRLDEMMAQGDAMAQRDAIDFHETKMNRTAGMMANAQQNALDANAARNAAIVGIGDAVVSGANVLSMGKK